MQSKQLPFSRIHRHYQRLNHILSFGLDNVWRRRAIRELDLEQGQRLLDIGVGSGDMLNCASISGITKVGIDPEMKMIEIGKYLLYHRVQGIAEKLPFDDGSFDRLASAFVLRNLIDRQLAFKELFRILKSDGKGVILEMSPPKGSHPVGWIIRWYIRTLVPFIGGLISGDSEAYRYLSKSVMEFPAPEEIAGELQGAGFIEVTSTRLIGWVTVLYRFVRPC